MLGQFHMYKSDISAYISLSEPAQQNILNVISLVFDIPVEKIPTGVDSCSEPTFYLPSVTLATMFTRLVREPGQYMKTICENFGRQRPCERSFCDRLDPKMLVPCNTVEDYENIVS